MLTTKDVIKKLQELDPTGNMGIILAVDSGEGYTSADKIFLDQIRKQPVDGDDIDCSSKDIAIFIGDHHAEQSLPEIYQYILHKNSIKKYEKQYKEDRHEEIHLCIKFKDIKNLLHKEIGKILPLDYEYEFVIYLDDEKRKIFVKQIGHVLHNYFQKEMIDVKKFNNIILDFFTKLASSKNGLKGYDDFNNEITIKKI
jgi:hypothetical protein